MAVTSLVRPGAGAVKRGFTPDRARARRRPSLSFGLANRGPICYFPGMNVERVKYVIWAADMNRAIRFYRDLFEGKVLKQNDVISEVDVAGAVIGIHGGGEGRRTWTGMSFQVADVVAGAREVVAAGGTLQKEPQSEDGEPPHLAMCVDPEGNEFMLTRRRGGT